jgi:hypothetical protein
MPGSTWRAMIVGLAVVGLLLGPAVPAPAEAVTYAPVDRPGPPLSVPEAELEASLRCSGDLAGADRAPVLLVPATWVTPEEQYGWTYMRAFDDLGWPYCAVTTPKSGMGDMQVSAEYVVHAIRSMYQRAGRRIALLGASQGGTLPRWALRFWPDTRSMVEEHVGIAPTNHGGKGIDGMCTVNCAPSLWQQRYQSNFVRALNSGQETFSGISYTELYTHQDQMATPASDDTGTSSLHGGGGRIANIAFQDVCPGHFAEHSKAATYDAVGYALAIDALTHDGPADSARIDPTVCGQELPPPVEPATFPLHLGRAFGALVVQEATGERVDEEPALRSYVTAD